MTADAAAADSRDVGEPSWKRDFAIATAVFVATRLAVAVFVWLTGQHFGCTGPRCAHRTPYPTNFLVNGLFQWDALHYQALVDRGYGPGQPITAPFFPVFPFAARALGYLFGSARFAGILLNQVSAVVGAVFAARLARVAVRPSPPSAALSLGTTTILFWLAAPVSFFFSVFLSESLFSCLAAIALWAAYRGKWVALGLSLAAVSGARVNGVLILLGAAIILWERRREVPLGRGAFLALAVAPLGLVWMLLLEKSAYGDAFAWVEAQRHWGRHLVLPTTTLHDDWKGFPGLNPARKNVDAMYRAQELLAAALTLPFLFLRRRLGLSVGLWVVGVLTWLMPLSSHSIIAFARYQAGNVYLAVAIPAVLTKHPLLQALAWWGFGLVFAWYASTFPHGVWAS